MMCRSDGKLYESNDDSTHRVTSMPTFKDNLATLRPIDGIESIVLTLDGTQVGEIPNAEGKRGSLAVYAHVLDFKDGQITTDVAELALALYAEKVDEAKAKPGEHPNIDHLLNLCPWNDFRAQIRYKTG
jgi:hypothetical protein